MVFPVAVWSAPPTLSVAITVPGPEPVLVNTEIVKLGDVPRAVEG